MNKTQTKITEKSFNTLIFFWGEFQTTYKVLFTKNSFFQKIPLCDWKFFSFIISQTKDDFIKFAIINQSLMSQLFFAHVQNTFDRKNLKITV